MPEVDDVVERVARFIEPEIMAHTGASWRRSQDRERKYALRLIEETGIAAALQSSQPREELELLRAENAHLSKMVCSGILGELLDEDENEALLAFIKTLRQNGSDQWNEAFEKRFGEPALLEEIERPTPPIEQENAEEREL